MEHTFTFKMADLMFVLPVICLVLASFIPLAIKVKFGNREQNSFAVMCYGIVGIVAALGSLVSMAGVSKTLFDGALLFNGVTTFVGVLILMSACMALVYSRENAATNNHQFSEFVFLLLNCTAGMLLVTWANDLIFFFVGIEMMSLCLYVMIAMSSEEKLSKESAFKYFLLGSLASAILLYGIALVFGTSNTTQLLSLAEVGPGLMGSSRLFLVGLVLLFAGLAFKVSVFPLHAWTPDVYQGAPTPLTGFMATGAKVATFAFFLKVISIEILAAEQAKYFLDALQWMAAFTILAGNIAAVMQTNLKRMLAYSSVAHSGYIMMGLLVAGLGASDPVGASSVIFYLAAYSVMTLGAFGILSLLERDAESSLALNDLKGLSQKHPWLALCFTLFLLSMGGIPPLVGFFSKLFVITAAIKAGFFWLAIWAVIGSVISVYFYLRPVVYMYMHESEGKEFDREGFLTYGLISLVALAVLIMGLFSHPVYNSVLKAIKS